MTNQINIYVVRHGQSQFNLKKTIGGTLEPNPLTPQGKQQAKALATKLAGINLDKIYSSTLTRAVSTAQIIAEGRGIDVITDALLNERYWGSLQGLTFDQARKVCPDAFIAEDTVDGDEAMKFKYVHDMECLSDTVVRFQRFLDQVVKTQIGKTILIVCHFDIMIGYLVKLGYGDYQRLMNAEFDHAGYYRLVSDGNIFEVKEVVGLNIKK